MGDHIRKTITAEVQHYVFRNIIAMLGTSLYVLIDTLFISISAGPLGLTTLNLALPLFNIFNAIGLLLGVGGATIFSLNKILHPQRVKFLYSDLIKIAFFLGLLIAILINIFTIPVVNFLGANVATRSMAVIYVRISAWAVPFLICNYISLNFIRNDNNPTLTMIATVFQITCVIILDWVFMFCFGLKLEGAAMAYFFSPVVSLIVLSFHRFSKGHQIEWSWRWPDFKPLSRCTKLGLASALNELSTGVSIYSFNFVLLRLANNYAVSAYGVISNIVLVVISIANGIALGVQPITSREYGNRHYQNVIAAFKVGLITTSVISIGEFIILLIFRSPIISAFNSGHSQLMQSYAMAGLPIYFTCVLFTACNILFILFLTSIGRSRSAYTMSLLRGYIILIPMIFLLSALFGISGVWAAVPVTEVLVNIFGIFIIRDQIRQLKIQTNSK